MSKTTKNFSNIAKFERTEDITNMNISYTQAVIIGITQGIACIPGISRSGSTIATAKMCKVQDSATYSFLISIPIIIASLIMEILESGNIGDASIISVIVSMIICFVVGLLSIKAMTNFVKNNKLCYFSYYLIALSAFLIFNDLIFHLF
jgi:undecaprenyl-diphosphatase